MKEKKYHTVFLDCAVPLFPISSSYFIIYLFLLYSLSAIRRVGWIINKKKFQKSKFVFFFFFCFKWNWEKRQQQKLRAKILEDSKKRRCWWSGRSIYTTTPDEFALIRRTIDELFYIMLVCTEIFIWYWQGFFSNDGRSFRRLFFCFLYQILKKKLLNAILFSFFLCWVYNTWILFFLSIFAV